MVQSLSFDKRALGLISLQDILVFEHCCHISQLSRMQRTAARPRARKQTTPSSGRRPSLTSWPWSSSADSGCDTLDSRGSSLHGDLATFTQSQVSRRFLHNSSPSFLFYLNSRLIRCWYHYLWGNRSPLISNFFLFGCYFCPPPYL